MLLWTFAGGALLVALAALVLARRLSRRLDALSQSYWELRYDYTRLRGQVARLDPDAAPSAPDAVTATAPPQQPTVAFVPLSTIKKRDQ